MNLADLSAKDVLDENGLAEYEAGINFFFSELVELNTFLYLAEKIMQFPFNLFASGENTVFFSMVLKSFHDAIVLSITRLVTDQGKDWFTLNVFKNKVRELIKPEFKNQFDERLRRARFDKEVDSLLKKTRDLRVNRIAHTSNAFILSSIPLYRLSMNELSELRNALNFLLNTISFNTEYVMLPMSYNQIDTGGQPDIEEILDCLARNSHVLNLPENSLEEWRHSRLYLSEGDLSFLNQYRRKFNLPEV